LKVSVLWACATNPLAGQSVSGRVFDAETGEPLADTEVSVVNDRGVVVARLTTGEPGGFLLTARNPGPHRIRAIRLGYGPFESQPIPLERLELTELEIQLARSPIALEPLTITGVRRDPFHDATFEGAMNRYLQFPSVGPRRVVLQSDAPMAGATRIRDVLRWFPSSRRCLIVFWAGRVVLSQIGAEMWLDDHPGHVEAIEYYRNWFDAPLGLRDAPPYIRDPYGCSILALWPPQAG